MAECIKVLDAWSLISILSQGLTGENWLSQVLLWPVCANTHTCQEKEKEMNIIKCKYQARYYTCVKPFWKKQSYMIDESRQFSRKWDFPKMPLDLQILLFLEKGREKLKLSLSPLICISEDILWNFTFPFINLIKF